MSLLSTIVNSLFLSQALTYHSFTFNLWFLHELKHKVRLSKTMCTIFHFRFCFVFKFIFLFKKMHRLFVKRYNFFQNCNNWKATHSFAPKTLIFKFQQEVLKFNDIFVSLGSPKTDPETNFLNLKNRSFENVSFSQ